MSTPDLHDHLDGAQGRDRELRPLGLEHGRRHDRPGGGGTKRDVVMVAHNGMCHDHVVLIKTMMRWSISPPKWRFADSLPIFKLVMRPDEDCTLATLAEVGPGTSTCGMTPSATRWRSRTRSWPRSPTGRRPA